MNVKIPTYQVYMKINGARTMKKFECASCKTTETTEYRKESNWHLCLTCHTSWLECEEEFNDETMGENDNG